MPSIKILPDNLINKIAAGEVVERPASVVKELVENAIDAGATDISVAVEQSGRRLIRIIDNGSGMSPDDARTAFERHATSKISAEADLEHIRTMGFRGEALSSIASVAQVVLTTARQGASAGTRIEIEGGTVRSVADAPAAPGTAIEVHHLFYNTPARLKFLKSAATELSHIVDAVSRQAMAHPDIRFKLTHGKSVIFDLPTAQGIRDRAFQLHGELTDGLMEFSGGRDGIRVYGMASKPNHDRGDRSYQEFYINSRSVRNASLAHALSAAYADLVMRDRYPAAFVFIDMDPSLVDVNVHPAKAEVRFRNQSQVHDLVRDVLREALGSHGRPTPQQVNEAYIDRVKEVVVDFASRMSGTPGLQPRSGSFDLDGTPAAGLFAAQAEIDRPASAMLYPLAQVHDSFIVAQSNDGMALVDQHAAHERVLFEKLQDQYAAGHVPQQALLIPVQVEAGRTEQGLLTEYLPELVRLGFLVEEFGGGTFVVKAVPALMTGADAGQLLTDIMDELRVHGKSGRLDALRDEVLSVMACHPAIKVHRRLSMQEMAGLLEDLFACRMPHSCPHGRPTVVRFPMDEIRKMFKRM